MSHHPAKLKLNLDGPDKRSSEEQFSIHVSRTLDILGKNQDMIKYRVNLYRDFQTLQNILFAPDDIISAGSKGEGLTAVFESDRDMMSVMPDVLCADNAKDFIDLRHITICQTERQNTPAGYTKLKLLKYEGQYSRAVIQNSLFQDEKRERYLSSEFLLTTLKQKRTGNGPMRIHETSGPSIKVSIESIDVDDVYGFCCACPNILQAFITRPRLYNRPARNFLNDITEMESHVVPVGFKGSSSSYQEWRICFTTTEIYLIQNLNDIETKLYILLKIISKILKNISNDITSYVMKNIVLWLVELYPENMFTEKLLIHQLVQALLFLKNCIEANYLPSYMIPERNLLAGKLNQIQSRGLTTFLSTLIHERGDLLFRSDKLLVAMTFLYREPEMAEEFRRRRDMVEKLTLLKMKINYENYAADKGHRYRMFDLPSDMST